MSMIKSKLEAQTSMVHKSASNLRTQMCFFLVQVSLSSVLFE